VIVTSKAEEFRRKVRECQRLAYKATSQYDREHHLRLVEHWLKMAAQEAATEHLQGGEAARRVENWGR
jgi:hypothetical protein